MATLNWRPCRGHRQSTFINDLGDMVRVVGLTFSVNEYADTLRKNRTQRTAKRSWDRFMATLKASGLPFTHTTRPGSRTWIITLGPQVFDYIHTYPCRIGPENPRPHQLIVGVTYRHLLYDWLCIATEGYKFLRFVDGKRSRRTTPPG